ncbi:formate--tetrahydrofolate ligase [Helcobacillus massiliensis]|uniref:formate--tetrahydrofolate ligase n=1 Tax=Helcobacillus TaxID=1161125 RepID=UPI001EF45DC0|nr:MULTISPECIES: formate--tetrahydrofolate ligase [Helcobacillus]MCG7427263.1 formate--tetrahydrofolate ligase [Helcobacillus sp. ACRRO]MCT1556552.1 formate--tetrahydrofolate ligase [Helcobacillus massiliensis]MCT2035746.1 formate--tetrahydrofolate ligase [Helcobacillus massiliensis]MCT2331172.1 formate--tetrahydrofolate ligase [Helcobacillus massiliensis]MDK7741949.1 formate--tetrahydrofolate ligase [Helcobacillus massiliensis]
MTASENPDLKIAQAHTLKPIGEIAEKAGIPEDALIHYGKHIAKVDMKKIGEPKEPAKLVLVSALSPTPAGEGKSTTTVGLADAFSLKGKNTMVALREPALGPIMGVKGGATGGGYAQVVPMENINLHFTGDFHAIQIANNTLAALVDNSIHQGNPLNIDPRRVQWKRVVDVNDRELRNIVVGLGGPAQGVPREDGFDIVVASEIMAVLCLATDLKDLEKRIGDIVVAYNYDREPVTVRELEVQGAITLLLKDALNPNLVQTLGGTPALVHGGPFANIAHGCNTMIATNLARSLGDIAVTEAGFGSDLGGEKFMDIKSRFGDFGPDAVVIVATVRALKMHGGVKKDDLNTENVDALLEGTSNLRKHVENVRKFGVEPVIALNRFPNDTEKEIKAALDWAEENGFKAALSEVWAKGGEGALELADQVLKAIDEPVKFAPIYDTEDGIENAIETIAKEIYGASEVQYVGSAPAALRRLKKNGWDKMPVCMAKTQYSFSDDPTKLGAPEGHVLHIRDLIPKLGAGFVVALTGDVMTMPGLPKQPAALRMGLDDNGEAFGLF